jgi:hypothetical protein
MSSRQTHCLPYTVNVMANMSAPQKVIGTLFVLLVAVMLIGSLTPGPVAGRSPLPPWVTLSPAADCSAGCWRIVAAEYWGEEESAGLHHAFARALDAQGNQQAGQLLTVAWPDGSVTVPTKPEPDWTDVSLWDCFFPDRNEVGAYRGWMGNKAQSDVIRGMGLPYCAHVSYVITWQWTPNGATATATTAPTVTRTATPSVVPTITPTPSHWLYLPIVQK